MFNVCIRCRTVAPLFALAILTLPGLASGGEIYSWKDASGRTHFSDVPPPGGEVKATRTAPPPAPSAAPAPASRPKSLAEQELEFRKRRAEQAEEKQKAEEENSRIEAKARNCEQLSRQIKALESGQRVSRLNSEGVSEYLDDKQRQQELERSQASYSKACN